MERGSQVHWLAAISAFALGACAMPDTLREPGTPSVSSSYELYLGSDSADLRAFFIRSATQRPALDTTDVAAIDCSLEASLLRPSSTVTSLPIDNQSEQEFLELLDLGPIEVNLGDEQATLHPHAYPEIHGAVEGAFYSVLFGALGTSENIRLNLPMASPSGTWRGDVASIDVPGLSHIELDALELRRGQIHVSVPALESASQAWLEVAPSDSDQVYSCRLPSGTSEISAADLLRRLSVFAHSIRVSTVAYREYQIVGRSANVLVQYQSGWLEVPLVPNAI